MSVKYFDKEKNKWTIFPGTIGAPGKDGTPGKDAYDIAKENGYTGTKEDYIAALIQVPDMATTVSNIAQTLYNQYSSVQLTSNPSIFETGVSTSVTLSIKVTYDNNKVVPSKLTLKKGETIISEDVNLTIFNDNINSTTTYTIETEVVQGVVKTSTSRINSYYPQYYGSSDKEILTSSDVLSFAKQPIKSSPVGNVSISVADNQYIWLCVPSGMNINKVTSSGFGVPMEQKIIVNVEGKTSYNCYRSSNKFRAGTFNGVIA